MAPISASATERFGSSSEFKVNIMDTSFGAMIGRLNQDAAMFQNVLSGLKGEMADLREDLSGEVYAAAQPILLDDSRLVASTIFDRLYKAAIIGKVGKGKRAIGGASVWGSQLLTWGMPAESLARGTEARVLEIASKLWLFGADTPISNSFSIGGFIGFSRGKYEFPENSHTVARHGTGHVGLYAAKLLGNNFGFRVNWTVSGHDVNTSRTVDFESSIEKLVANYDAFSTRIVGEFSNTGILKLDRAFGPYLQVSGSIFSGSPFIEDGGITALEVSKSSFSSLVSTFGVRGVDSFSKCPTVSRLYYMLGFRKEMLVNKHTPSVSGKLVNVDNSSYSVSVVASPASSVVLRLGLDFDNLWDKNLIVSFGIQGLLSNLSKQGSVNLDMKWAF